MLHFLNYILQCAAGNLAGSSHRNLVNYDIAFGLPIHGQSGFYLFSDVR